MKNGTISIDPQVLRNSANQLAPTVEAMVSIYSVLKQIEAEIYNAWNSDYTDMYVEYLLSVQHKAEKIRQYLEKVQKQLRDTAQRTEDTEKQVIQILQRKEQDR